MTDSQKRELLRVQVDKFKELKEQLTRAKTADLEKKETKPTGKKEPAVAAYRKAENIKAAQTPAGKSGQEQRIDTTGMVTPAALAYILEEIRQTIRAEFKALREDLKRSQG